MGIYEELGVRRFINAWGTVTILGGSVMPEPVVQAMVDAARSYVTLRELQDRAGARIAEMVGVEAALVSSGAAGGITLAAAACITGADWDRVYRLPDTSGLKNEIVVVQAKRPNYMYQAAEHVGARLIHVGSPERVAPEDFSAAIGPRTAAVLLVVASLDHQRDRSSGVTATVENVAAVARRAGVPVIVPNSSIGRPMKVGKEEMAGLVKAVEIYVQRDEEAELRRWEATCHRVAEQLAGVPGVRTEVVVSGRYARPPIVPVCLIHLDSAGVTRDEVDRRLMGGDPGIGVGKFDGGLIVNPMTLLEGEEIVVAQRLRDALLGR